MEKLTLLIFLFTYFAIAIQKLPGIKIDRPSGVLVGSTLLVVSGGITLPMAYSYIDWDVITFLLGMMIMTAYLELAGFFPVAARFIVKRAHSGNSLLAFVIAGTALLSALFVNDTICLLFTPMLLAATRALKVNPIPYLLAVAFSSNIGSALTVTGNPQNIYIGIVSGISFLEFMINAAVPVLLSLVVVYIVLYLMYKKELTISDTDFEITESHDSVLMLKSLLALAITLALFLFHVSYPVAAMIGATAVILTGRVTPKAALAKVDWQLLIFFAGLFVVMGALGDTSYMNRAIEFVTPYLERNDLNAVLGVGGIALLLSNLVSNVPAVMIIYPVIDDMGLAVYLAVIATFAGNLTLVGSVANLIVAEKANQYGVNLSFMTYLKAGVIITLLSSAIAVAYTYLTI
ncbi:MAG: hypothetical protein LBV09_06325 [Deferribacteraceae bacterium]|jgi:Na+/H+ antiporter NhaD/arsenite permease-like protein|nr:hypothetical protein [Deferribacteraceae bacterium]